MAKQSGLHQIKGKVGEHSYYRQSGVESGLIRSINQGLSERVKTDQAYVNTRLNNAEFGQACKIAARLVQYITPKFRPMILPFSQSKMAKLILEQIKVSSGAWGQRNFTDPTGEVSAPLLSSLAKNNFDEYGLSFGYGSGTEPLQLVVDEVLAPAKLAAIGADGYNVRVVFTDTWVGDINATTGKYADSFARGNNYDSEGLTAGDTFGLDEAEYPLNPPTGWPAHGIRMVVVVVMPYRTINSTKHILQEHCTFKAFEEMPVEP